ncbi:unnamed protein product [Didymodactylos carnosus]|uniref:RING-type domain-containing protein n=1 Tax=Didymodactylos carnosus TaxID=1234261 RepID=A0A814GTD7_9BILA|nr:unnamed protein product [Didymodactylos carnosus]CAF1000390.1 unnamed protein product [Didymodactylos carnosus]CAF3611760.1 unnamed protein product [Didymodactylos carnosus]CAF3771844.1 unnamed protein product [Didymodactylos carnosus]
MEIELNELFQCKLCHGYITQATVINECLHRFCKSCIVIYFQSKSVCPICNLNIRNPWNSLKSDVMFQRLIYKMFPSILEREITDHSTFIKKSSNIFNIDSLTIHCGTTIDVYLEYWDLASELLPVDCDTSPISTLPSCYLHCAVTLPIRLVEKFIRMKHSIGPTLKIDLFYKTYLLDLNERLIDVCYCYNQMHKRRSLDVRFVISQKGYLAIIQYLRKQNFVTAQQSEQEQDTARSLRPRLSSTVETNRTPKATRRQSITTGPTARRSVRNRTLNDEQPCIAVERFIEDPVIEDDELTPLHIDTTRTELSVHSPKNVDAEITSIIDQLPVKTSDITNEKPILSSGTSPTSSMTDAANDAALKVRIRRAKTSWYIPQLAEEQHKTDSPSDEQPLPDLINSCSKKITKRKKPLGDKSSIPPKKKLCTTADFFSSNRTLTPSIVASTTQPAAKRKKRKPRFVPTMVKPPTSIFDREHLLIGAYDYCDEFDFRVPSIKNSTETATITAPRSPEMVIINVEGGVEASEISNGMGDSTASNLHKKNICKVPPYVPETSSLSPVKSPIPSPVIIVPTSNDKTAVVTVATSLSKKNDIPPAVVDVSTLTTTTGETPPSTKKIRILNSSPKLKTAAHKPLYITKSSRTPSSSSIITIPPNMTAKRTLLPKTTLADKSIKIVSTSTSSNLSNSVRNITLTSSDKMKQPIGIQCDNPTRSSLSTIVATPAATADTTPLDLSMKRC